MTVSNSLQSIIHNWEPLQELWDGCLTVKLVSKLKTRILGVKHKTETYECIFRAFLGVLFMRIVTTFQNSSTHVHQ